jgi:peptidoglycan lytic transglycosylase G
MMGRHRGGGNDEGYGEGVWLPGGYAGEADNGQRGTADGFTDPYQATRTSPGQDAHTGPPWDQPDPPWDEAPGPWDQQPREPWDTGGQPWDTGCQPWDTGGPGPADLGPGHPSGPLPPVRPLAPQWPEPPAPGYAGPDDPGVGYHDDESAGYPDGNGDGYTGYPEPGYHDQPYPHLAYQDARFTGRDAGYADDGGYPDGDGDEYAGSMAGRHSDRDYRDRGDWYGDVDDDQDWADEDGDAGFVPGLTGGTGRADGRLDDHRPLRGGRSGPRPGGTRKSRMRRIAQWLALSVVVVLLLGAGAAYYYVDHNYLHPPDYTGPGTGWVTVRIYPGDSAATVGQRLQQAGVVETARAFQNAAKASGQGSSLEPGYYRVHRHMAAALAFALLLKPSSREQTRITIPEGLRLSQIITELGRATGNPAGYQQAIKDVPALGLPSYAKGSPEGYLFPATYDVQPNTPPARVLKTMVARFGVEAASVSLPTAAAHAQLTEGQVIVVASLIQAEGRNPADFPKIAEVIYNRLNSGIKLQLDSTVMYALHTYGIRATSTQARVRSPYNTYLHTGLPPGPIDSPGDVAIRAALHPAHGNLMYFVTVDPKTGLTKFTSSYAVAQQYEAELSANLAKGR